MAAADAAPGAASGSAYKVMDSLRQPFAARPGLKWLAAAAVLLLGLGAVTYSAMRTFSPISRQPITPNSTMLAMVATHDSCCEAHAADHHMLDAPRGDFRAISQELSRRLNQPVFVADLSAEGWAFHGAAICPVGGRDTAHLMYLKEGQTLSLFSLPPQAAGDCGKIRRGDCLRQEIQRHPVLLAQCKSGLVGWVGRADRGRLTVDELDQLYRRHQDDAVAASPAPLPNRALASSR